MLRAALLHAAYGRVEALAALLAGGPAAPAPAGTSPLRGRVCRAVVAALRIGMTLSAAVQAAGSASPCRRSPAQAARDVALRIAQAAKAAALAGDAAATSPPWVLQAALERWAHSAHGAAPAPPSPASSGGRA